MDEWLPSDRELEAAPDGNILRRVQSAIFKSTATNSSSASIDAGASRNCRVDCSIRLSVIRHYPIKYGETLLGTSLTCNKIIDMLFIGLGFTDLYNSVIKLKSGFFKIGETWLPVRTVRKMAPSHTARATFGLVAADGMLFSPSPRATSADRSIPPSSAS